jgi:hypothetical protein
MQQLARELLAAIDEKPAPASTMTTNKTKPEPIEAPPGRIWPVIWKLLRR